MKVLMIDIGGSNVKVMVSGKDEMRKMPSGRTLTARQMVAGVKRMTKDWDFDVIALGFPGLVENGKLANRSIFREAGCTSTLPRPLVNQSALLMTRLSRRLLITVAGAFCLSALAPAWVRRSSRMT